MLVTYDARDEKGTAGTLRFALCERKNWPGGKRSNKVGNTCHTHCGGIALKNAVVNNELVKDCVMKKCTWLRCCYGKKPYGNPPLVPWCSSCEFQKKLLRRPAPVAGAAGGVSVTAASPTAPSQPNQSQAGAMATAPDDSSGPALPDDNAVLEELRICAKQVAALGPSALGKNGSSTSAGAKLSIAVRPKDPAVPKQKKPPKSTGAKAPNGKQQKKEKTIKKEKRGVAVAAVAAVMATVVTAGDDDHPSADDGRAAVPAQVRASGKVQPKEEPTKKVYAMPPNAYSPPLSPLPAGMPLSFF